MRKLAYSLVLALFFIPCQLSAKYQFEEKFYLPLPQILSKWKVGCQKQRSNGEFTTRYILENETMDNWSQLVNVQFKERTLVKCANALAAMKQEASLNCGVAFKLHTESENDIIFEKTFPSGMHELVRMVMTDRGLHRIAYTRRDAPFEESDRNQWLERLSKGKVETE